MRGGQPQRRHDHLHWVPQTMHEGKMVAATSQQIGRLESPQPEFGEAMFIPA